MATESYPGRVQHAFGRLMFKFAVKFKLVSYDVYVLVRTHKRRNH